MYNQDEKMSGMDGNWEWNLVIFGSPCTVNFCKVAKKVEKKTVFPLVTLVADVGNT